MKKVLLTFIAVGLLVSACTEKDISLVGTNWFGSFETDVYQPAGHVHVLSEYTVYFADDTAGTMLMQGTATLQGNPPYREEQEVSFTYSFDGKDGTLTTTNERGTLTRTFAYHDRDDVLVMDITDANISGVNEIVFRRQ